jgi:hypothetical protein
MDGLALVIANKIYSLWSLRAWSALKQRDVPVSEVGIPPSASEEALSERPPLID